MRRVDNSVASARKSVVVSSCRAFCVGRGCSRRSPRRCPSSSSRRFYAVSIFPTAQQRPPWFVDLSLWGPCRSLLRSSFVWLRGGEPRTVRPRRPSSPSVASPPSLSSSSQSPGLEKFTSARIVLSERREESSPTERVRESPCVVARPRILLLLAAAAALLRRVLVTVVGHGLFPDARYRLPTSLRAVSRPRGSESVPHSVRRCRRL